MIIKICGMRNPDNIREVEKLGPDMMGFIFYPHSMRFVSVIPAYLPRTAMRVGVFVNEDSQTILSTASRFSLRYLQLHGNESPALCRELLSGNYGIIKAFPVKDRQDVERTKRYEGLCDYYLFDTSSSSIGGSGKQFDWKLLEDYEGSTPFILSGGIGVEDAERIRELSFPLMAGIDLNSRFEISPAMKDTGKLKTFINIFRNNE